MADYKSKVQELINLETVTGGGVKNNKVANFSYNQTAYTNNDAAGVSEFDQTKNQNIPLGNAAVMSTNQTVLDRGYRSQGSSIGRMLANHFWGRTSYNLNKIHDWFTDFLTAFKVFSTDSNTAWKADVTYAKDDYCFTYSSSSYKMFKSKKADNINHDPSALTESNEWWEIIKSKEVQDVIDGTTPVTKVADNATNVSNEVLATTENSVTSLAANATMTTSGTTDSSIMNQKAVHDYMRRIICPYDKFEKMTLTDGKFICENGWFLVSVSNPAVPYLVPGTGENVTRFGCQNALYLINATKNKYYLYGLYSNIESVDLIFSDIDSELPSEYKDYRYTSALGKPDVSGDEENVKEGYFDEDTGYGYVRRFNDLVLIKNEFLYKNVQTTGQYAPERPVLFTPYKIRMNNTDIVNDVLALAEYAGTEAQKQDIMIVYKVG